MLQCSIFSLYRKKKKKLEESHLPTVLFEDVTPNTYNNFFWPDKSDHQTDANVAEQKKTFRNIKGGELQQMMQINKKT